MEDSTPFAAELRRLRTERGLSLRALAAEVHHGKSYVHDLETGRRAPTGDVARRLDAALCGEGRLTAVAREPAADDGAELEALELTRRVTASDVSEPTLQGLEAAKDELATAYATTRPEVLLPQVSRHLRYVVSLVDARKTLTQHRRLLVTGGWLALLRATLHIDLRQGAAAAGYLTTAGRLAAEADHREITAWCRETQAWDLLTGGDFRRALALSQAAQAVAPADSSAFVQATAQEGRAWARLGDRARTARVLTRIEKLAGAYGTPDHPEHHYQYDPAKARAYTATTLSWVGDPAAEQVARDVVAELTAEGERPRRLASARLDLGLALLTAGKPDEAAGAASEAIGSGRVVPSNWWRVTEVVRAVQNTGVAAAAALRDEYETFRPV